MDISKYLKESFNINLSKQQLKTTNHVDGPAIILAVAGSGKTTSLVARTGNLILNHNIDPEKIYTMTFSKASAKDMESRFNELFSEQIKRRAHFSTIHSFAYKIVSYVFRKKRRKLCLIEEDNKKGFNISKFSIISSAYLKYNKEYPTEDKIETIITQISYIKNRMIPFIDLKDDMADIQNFKKIYKYYQVEKNKLCLMDFDDLLIYTLKILQGSRTLLNFYRNKFSHIQVDEFQDTSPVQFEIIKLIAYPKNNLFVVGDDDQGIYSFRGTEPEIMLNFPSIYKDSKLYFMEENFRSTNNIVSISNKIIKNNKNRYKKNIFTNNKDFKNPIIKSFKDEKHQINYIIKSLKESDELSDTAILFRNNISSILLINYLNKNNLPFYIRDYKNKFFNHWVIKDLFAFINISKDPTDIDEFSKIYYKTNAYISKDIIDYTKDYISKNKENKMNIFDIMSTYPYIKQYTLFKIKDLKKDFKKLKTKSKDSIFYFIKNTLGYGDFLYKKSEANTDGPISIFQTLSILLEDANYIDEIPHKIEDFKLLLENNKNKRENSVVLSTIHSAKGLEFKRVFLIDLVENSFPTYNSIKSFHKLNNPKELEEERRLFYVGITRAKESLTICSLEKRANKDVDQSRFIDEIKNKNL